MDVSHLLTRTLVRDTGLEIVHASVPLSRSTISRLIVAKMIASTKNWVPTPNRRLSRGCSDRTLGRSVFRVGRQGADRPLGDPSVCGGKGQDGRRGDQDDPRSSAVEPVGKVLPDEIADTEQSRRADPLQLGGGGFDGRGVHAARSFGSMSRRKASSRSTFSGALVTRVRFDSTAYRVTDRWTPSTWPGRAWIRNVA